MSDDIKAYPLKTVNFTDPQDHIDIFVKHEMKLAKQLGITDTTIWAKQFIYKHYSPPSEGKLARVANVQSHESLILNLAKNADIAVNGRVSEACGAVISDLAESDYDTEVLARTIFGDAIKMRVPCPNSLFELADEVIAGRPMKPKHGDHAWNKKVRRDICLEGLSVLVFGFEMQATKNEGTRGVGSACDIISTASDGLGGLSITQAAADAVWRKQKNL